MARTKTASASRRTAPQGTSERQYIIQLQVSKLSLDALRNQLIASGVELDPNYGPVNVNPAAGHFVVRGRASDAAKKRAESIEGVSFFGDAKVGPTRS